MKRRKLPPGSRHHEYWCAIFYGRRCNCDDNGDPPRITRRGGPSGAEPPKKDEKRELEEV